MNTTLPLWVNLALVGFGIGAHAVSKLSELEARGQPSDVKGYLTDHKWTALSVVLSAFMLFLLQWQLGEGGPIGAILTGFSCNSAGDKLRARAEATK